MSSNLGKTGPAIALGMIVLLVVGGLLWRQSTMRASAIAPLAAVENNQPVATTDAMPAALRRAEPRRMVTQAERLKLATERNRRRKDMMDRVSDSNAALAARHRSEQIDPQWAARMETQLQDVSRMSGFKESGVTPTTLDIDCKATTCKIDAGLANRSLGEDWAMIYMSSVGSNVKRAYTSVVTDPDGTSRVVIYAVAR